MNYEKMIVTDPSNNYQILAEVVASTPEEIDVKVKLARESFVAWSQVSVQERVKILRGLYDQFQKRQDEIAHAIAQEMGMPIAICKKIDVCVGLAHMQCYLDNAPTWLEPDTVYESYKERHVVYFEPHGVIGISIPWNYPFTNFIWAVIQNLVAGNTVVVKHSEYCMLATKLFEQIFIEAQVPVGVCSFVYGKGFDAGNYLMHGDVDRIWFTGSTQTGQAIYQIAAQKMIPATLELGGSAAGIVFDDIDLDLIMPSLYFYRFLNSGQTCDGLKRLIVHRSVFEKVVDKLTAFIATQKVGSALDPATVMGPLVNQKQLEGVEAQVRDAVKRGARVVTGGKRPEGLSGAYFEPTILTNVSRDMAVWAQEVFGPVLPIVPFDSEQEAIELANDTIYGLGGYIFTSDTQRAARVAAALKTGNISINGANYVLGADPFGGYKKSGIGRIHGKLGMRDLCAVKTVATLKNRLLVKIMLLIYAWLPKSMRCWF